MKMFYLRFWGSAQKAICEEMRCQQDLWFDTAADRSYFIHTIRGIANKHGDCVVVSEFEGPDTYKRTVASMVFTLPDGRSYPYMMDFGYGYPVDSAHYMFHDGNYGCDCNRSLFINETLRADGLPEIEEFDCGGEIVVSDFKVEQVVA